MPTSNHVKADNSLVVHASRPSVATLRNGQPPVSKIPPELLTGIFSSCATADPIGWVAPSPRSQARPRFNPGWLNLSHVCSFWRNAALHYPALWAPYATNEFGLQWMEAILRRSMRMSVLLRFDLTRATPANVALLGKHMSHISDITFTGQVKTMTALFNVLTSPAPMLDAVRMETGTISVEYIHRLWHNLDISIPVLSADVFSLQAPRLRQLSLVNYLPPLTVPVSQTLLGVEHLSITTWTSTERSLVDSADAASTAKLCAVLQHMKQLRTLELRHCLPPRRGHNGSTNNHIIDLPHLRSLDIDDGAPECGIFLRRLRIPTTAQLSIHCSFGFHGFQEEWFALTSFLQTHLGAESPPIQALSLALPDFDTHSDCISMKVVAWRSLVIFPTNSPPPGFAISFTLDIPTDDHRVLPSHSTVMRALDALSLASVQVAQYTLQREGPEDVRQVKAAMRCTPKVESLWVTGPGSAAVADALRPQRTAGDSVPPTYTLWLPSLRMLGFKKVNLGAKRSSQLKHDYRRLRGGLQARKDLEGRTLKLGIQKCAMKPRWLERLREVADVEWDGNNRSFSNE